MEENVEILNILILLTHFILCLNFFSNFFINQTFFTFCEFFVFFLIYSCEIMKLKNENLLIFAYLLIS